MKIKRLHTYCSTALGTTAFLASHSDAATVIDVNGSTFDTTLSGIGTVARFGDASLYTYSAVTTSFDVRRPTGGVFRRGADARVVNFSGAESYIPYSLNQYAIFEVNYAVFNSSDNWLYAVAASDGAQQVWLQFRFGDQGDGTGFSIIRAVFPDSPGELTSALAASDAVPESSSLVLLSLGASGLLIRRRKKIA